MTDGQGLWLLLALFYVSECGYWVPRGAVVWKFGGKRRSVAGGIGNERGQLVWQNPLEGSGGCSVLDGWPYAVTETGLSGVRAEVGNPGGRGRSRDVRWAWGEVEKIWARNAEVMVDGVVLARCVSGAAAVWHATFLRRLRDADEGERAAVVREGLEGALDGVAAGERWGRFSRDARWAAFWCGSVTWAMLVFVPAVYWWFGDGIEVWVSAGVMWVLMLVATVLCFRLHARWFPAGRGERWQQLVISAVAPPHAARGVDGVSRNVMPGVHPLAPDESGRKFAAAMRDAWFPVRDVVDETSDEFREVFWKPALREAAERRGTEFDAVFAPPDEREEGSDWYCPRCHSGYVEAIGDCADCEGVGLKRFESPGEKPSS